MLAVHLARIAAIVAVVLTAFTVRPACAADALRGVVVSALPASGEVVVRHESFGGMPAMTMLFRVEPKSAAAALHAGDRIDARVMLTKDAAILANVRVVGTQDAAGGPIVRDVQPLNAGDEMPLTPFFDQLGRGFTFNDFRGKTVVLAFIYTRCRDPRMCPLVSANFHLLQRKLADLPVHLVEISLDPGYDTPEVLANYGRRFDADPATWTLGTGPQKVVDDFAARFGIAVFTDPTAGLIHSERSTRRRGTRTMSWRGSARSAKCLRIRSRAWTTNSRRPVPRCAATTSPGTPVCSTWRWSC